MGKGRCNPSCSFGGKQFLFHGTLFCGFCFDCEWEKLPKAETNTHMSCSLRQENGYFNDQKIKFEVVNYREI